MHSRTSVLLGSVLLCALAAACGMRCHAQPPKALLLFGGVDHKVFLGCLNCVDTSTLSVCNEFGRYGNEFQLHSIWNKAGSFGSEFSGESPWNESTTDAPIIVDKDGISYGYFSTNGYHRDRTQITWLVTILDHFERTNDLTKTRKMMCGY
jgi:hypothetical protein